MDANNGNYGENIQQNVTDAINSCVDGFATIKITSNLYEERIDITKPGIEIRPKEKGGEVTIQQKTDPCFVIDIGEGNVCTLENLRMLLKGPNRDAEPQSFMADMNFEQQGNEECMKEFFTHILKKTPTRTGEPLNSSMIGESKNKQYCIILLKSGTLIMNNCILSLE